MVIREGEQILKVFHHHPTPFVLNLFKTILAFIPFYFILFILQDLFSSFLYFIVNVSLLVLFAVVVLYSSLIYWLDKLIVTNQRVIFINWVGLTKRRESEAFLNDISDVQTSEKGVFSYFWVLDYGFFSLATSATKVTIIFDQANDPEGIRQFIYHVRPQI